MSKVLAVKLKEKGTKTLIYNNKINPEDFKQLALLFLDLSNIYNYPIEKAFFEFKRREEENFPW